jgi:G3E family GTPase
VAEPLPICWTFEVEPLAARVRAAAVVTVVDALEHERHRPVAPAVDLQVEYADVLITSKLDLVPGGRISDALERSLRQLNPHAPLVDGPAALWRVLVDPPMTARPRPGEAPHTHGDEGPPLDSIALELPDTLDFEELSEQLEALPASYVRIKGIARVVDRTTGSAAPHTVAFHRVGARVSSEPLAADAPPRMVALGTGLDRGALAACVAAAVLPSVVDVPGPGGGRRS